MADKVVRRPMARLREQIEAKGGIAVVPMWRPATPPDGTGSG